MELQILCHCFLFCEQRLSVVFNGDHDKRTTAADSDVKQYFTGSGGVSRSQLPYLDPPVHRAPCPGRPSWI